MGLCSRRRLLLLASHRMAPIRERKNPSRIAREIEIFSIFAWLVPTLVPKHNARFRAFRHRHVSFITRDLHVSFTTRDVLKHELWSFENILKHRVRT